MQSKRRASTDNRSCPYAEITVDDVPLVLCHYPFRTWNGMGKGAINLHGHSHARLKPMKRQFDIGVVFMGFNTSSIVEHHYGNVPKLHSFFSVLSYSFWA